MIKAFSNSVQETIDLGAQIGSKLSGGEVFAITGNLGAGKTHFIKGIVKGIFGNQESELVSSPTFVLVKEYSGAKLEIYHIDAYRLETSIDFDNLGFDDMCNPGSVVLVEWADKVETSLKGVSTINVNIIHKGPNLREITVDNFEM